MSVALAAELCTFAFCLVLLLILCLLPFTFALQADGKPLTIAVF